MFCCWQRMNSKEEEESEQYESEADLPINELTNLSICTICYDIIDDPILIMGCLHRFCRACIKRNQGITSAIGHSCPMCRTKVASTRDFKPELFMKDLVNILFDIAPPNVAQAFSIEKYTKLNIERQEEMRTHAKEIAKRLPIGLPTPNKKRQKSQQKAKVTQKANAQGEEEEEVVHEIVNFGLIQHLPSASVNILIIFHLRIFHSLMLSCHVLSFPIVIGPSPSIIPPLPTILLHSF